MTQVVYTAKRKLQGGILVGDTIVFDFPTSLFQPDISLSESKNTAIGGQVQVSLKHFFDTWSVKTSYDATNTQADYEQFLYSVLGGVPFTITDYDHSDEVKNVILNGKFTKEAIRRFNAGEFDYTFSVREI